MNTEQILSRDDVMREWRDGLIEKLGSETLADAQIRYELEAAEKMRARHNDLRAELRVLDAELATHNEESAARLASLREAADRLLAESNAAFVRLESARIAYEAQSTTKFRNRMNEIREELGRPYSPLGPHKTNWRHGPKMDAQSTRSN